jgi:hypothetical protein
MRRTSYALIFSACLLKAGLVLAAGTSVYSERSVRILCSDPKLDASCRAYVLAVVETWMMKDVVGEGAKEGEFVYRSSNKNPPFCDRILEYDVNEWVTVVKSNPLKPGFGVSAIMEVLDKAFCHGQR